ncbi:MAG: hypothetical protein QMD76_01905 [Anaerosomatales bacterium]|nr:hypothetical protein [Anaerosomatales bacterium]
MGDVPRREPRKFEPPPWERDAFEELKRRKEQERAERELEEALERARLAAELPAEEQSGAPEARPVAEAAAPESTGRPAQIDERQVERMLIQLSLEEPRATQQVSTVATAVAAGMAAAGLGFVVWSAVLFARTRATTDAVPAASPLVTTIASLLMMLWGFMMIGGAVLLWRRHNVR